MEGGRKEFIAKNKIVFIFAIIMFFYYLCNRNCIKSGLCSLPTGLFVGNGGKTMRVNDEDLFTKQ